MAYKGSDFWFKARRTVKMSQLAYSSLTVFDKEFPGAEYINIKETVAYVWKPQSEDKVIYVAFRGTDATKKENILTDIDFKRDMVDFMKGSVHGGFKDALSLIWDKLYELIKDHIEEDIIFCGHSLGAALALLAAARANKAHFQVYTYGCPRVGDAKFAENLKCKDQVYRFINGFDIVTRIPWRIWGYVNIGEIFRYDQDRNLIQNGESQLKNPNLEVSSNKNFSFLNDIDGNEAIIAGIAFLLPRSVQTSLLLLYFENQSIQDHSLNKYVENVEKSAKLFETPMVGEN